MNIIKGRLTPWDTMALGRKTFEILSISLTESNFDKALSELKDNSFCDADLIYGRFSASNLLLKEVMLKSGYIPCETTHRVALTRVRNYSLPSLFAKRISDLELLDKELFPQIADIASDMFGFSRFHEDPFIPNKLANRRMSSWVTDMMDQDVSALVDRNKNGSIVSFMIYKLEHLNEAKLILGGSKKGYELHSSWFWGSVVAYLKKIGVNKIYTTISAANNGVISLYQNLNFKITQTSIDYHKHVSHVNMT